MVDRPPDEPEILEFRSPLAVRGVVRGPAREYRIVGVLGRGGFGVVYRARLEGSEGFVKDVAIKILHAASPTADTLARFRDEARILGRIQDRAIVGVDPPLLIDGRWAVIMDYIDGVNCQKLLRQHGTMPATVAFEIVQEIARALDTLWHVRSDGAGPLRLLHRDLKPGNIQITPSGTVKILDFGVARADFATREMVTQVNISGTTPYVAPERLKGEEGPAGDIWSLGVVLEQLVSGRNPGNIAAAEDVPEIPSRFADGEVAAIALARRMRSALPADRPSAAVVEDECRRFAHTYEGPTLRDWARAYVTPGLEPDDEWVGRTFTDVSTWSTPSAGPAARWAPPWRTLLVAGLAAAAVAFVWWLAAGRDSPTDEAEPTSVSSTTITEPVSAPGPVDLAPEVSDATEITPTPVPAPRRAPASTRAPAVEAPTVEAPTVEVPTVVAPPMGHVVVEGVTSLQLVGMAGTFSAGDVPAGTYAVYAAFDRDQLESAGEVTVGAGQTVTLVCRAAFKRCMSK